MLHQLIFNYLHHVCTNNAWDSIHQIKSTQTFHTILLNQMSKTSVFIMASTILLFYYRLAFLVGEFSTQTKIGKKLFLSSKILQIKLHTVSINKMKEMTIFYTMNKMSTIIVFFFFSRLLFLSCTFIYSTDFYVYTTLNSRYVNSLGISIDFLVII